MLKKIWRNLEEGILIPMLAFSTVLLFVQVVMRKGFNNSLSWSEELARFLYLWEVWLGIAFATKTKAHLSVTLIFNVVKGKAAKVLQIAVYTLWFAFGAFMIYYGLETAMRIADFGQKSSALQIPMWIPYMSIPVGATLMNIRLIECAINLIKEGPKED